MTFWPADAAHESVHTSAAPSADAVHRRCRDAQGPVNAPKMDSVLSDLDTRLQQLATGDPKAALQSFDKNAKAALGG
jgi:multiple sugar transport system substrate-binding protein